MHADRFRRLVDGAALVPADAGQMLTDGVAAFLRYADTGAR